MIGQFRRYASGVTLVPFGGTYSISLMSECIKRLEAMAEKYQRPPVILYFGDLDRWGIRNIFEPARRDAQAWYSGELEFIRVGLTEEQVARYHIPENPDKPGQFQWEALEDEQAEEIIVAALGEYLDFAKVRRAKELSERQTKLWSARLGTILRSILRDKETDHD